MAFKAFRLSSCRSGCLDDDDAFFVFGLFASFSDDTGDGFGSLSTDIEPVVSTIDVDYV